MSAPQTKCLSCGGILQPSANSPDLLQCASCGALVSRRRQSHAGIIILTILGVFVVAIGIVFAGCAYIIYQMPH